MHNSDFFGASGAFNGNGCALGGAGKDQDILLPLIILLLLASTDKNKCNTCTKKKKHFWQK